MLDDPAATEVSEEFVGRWNTLISTTNWEKGRIIGQWRQALVETGAPATCYSDEAWSKRVGGVSSQHVGRLRRVFERFGGVFETYPKLYWTHFLAASDWEDAEMWLEGATQSQWSVSEMRESRWKTLGEDPTTKPRHDESAQGVIDEDFVPLAEMEDSASRKERDPEEDDRIGSTGPLNEGPDFGDEDRGSSDRDDEDDDDVPFDHDEPIEKSVDNPFVSLPKLPVDIAEAMENFKLAIVRHRSTHWSDISQSNLLRVLDALRQFVAPHGDPEAY